MASIADITTWTFYDGKTPAGKIGPTVAFEMFKVVRATAYIHSVELSTNAHEVIRKKVNAGGVWRRIRAGFDNKGRSLVVIIYHRLKHNGQVGGKPPIAWSVSLGVHSSLMPFAEIGEDPPAGSYLDLAGEIIKYVHYDAKNNLGANAHIVIYDHVTPAGATPPSDGLKPDADRRMNEIGELGFVAEQVVVGQLGTNWTDPPPEWKLMVERPVDGSNKPIPGWGRDKSAGFAADDKYCIRTTLVPM